jgi:hypothetical protein
MAALMAVVVVEMLRILVAAQKHVQAERFVLFGPEQRVLFPQLMWHKHGLRSFYSGA